MVGLGHLAQVRRPQTATTPVIDRDRGHGPFLVRFFAADRQHNTVPPHRQHNRSPALARVGLTQPVQQLRLLRLVHVQGHACAHRGRHFAQHVHRPRHAVVLGQSLEDLLLRVSDRQKRHALRQRRRGVSSHDAQLQFQRGKRVLPVLTRLLEGLAGEAAKADRSEAGADTAAVVGLLLFPTVFLLLVGEAFRQAFGIFGLQPVEDDFQDLAADLPQTLLQILLQLKGGLRRDGATEKGHYGGGDGGANLLQHGLKFFLDLANILGKQGCQEQAEKITILHGRRPFLETGLLLNVLFAVSRERRLPFQDQFARRKKIVRAHNILTPPPLVLAAISARIALCILN